MTSFGHPRRHYRVTDSTNERARELARSGAPSGTVVTAGAQTAGRGRRGRTWEAPAGKALLYTAILRPLDARHALLPLAAPVAVCEAIESLAPVGCRIKWPNDVWICEPETDPGEGEAGSGDSGPEAKPGAVGEKVAGVLIEARAPDWAVIGVGVNVAIEPGELPADVRWPATSIGHGVEVEDARRALDGALAAWVEPEPAALLAAYRERDALAGLPVSWEDAGGARSGIADGIDEDGNLLVVVGDGGRLALGAGEVSLSLG